LVIAAFDLDGSLLRPRPTKELGLAAARPERAGLSTEKVRRHLGLTLAAPAAALREMAG
jgi:dTDP-4-dehydrorhamnose reductase